MNPQASYRSNRRVTVGRETARLHHRMARSRVLQRQPGHNARALDFSSENLPASSAASSTSVLQARAKVPCGCSGPLTNSPVAACHTMKLHPSCQSFPSGGRTLVRKYPLRHLASKRPNHARVGGDARAGERSGRVPPRISRRRAASTSRSRRPRNATEIFADSSLTTMTRASVSSLRPIAAR